VAKDLICRVCSRRETLDTPDTPARPGPGPTKRESRATFSEGGGEESRRSRPRSSILEISRISRYDGTRRPCAASSSPPLPCDRHRGSSRELRCNLPPRRFLARGCVSFLHAEAHCRGKCGKGETGRRPRERIRIRSFGGERLSMLPRS